MRRSESDVAETAPWRSFRRSCRSRFILPSLSAGEEATVVGLVSQANPAQPRIRFWHCHIIQVPEYRSSPSSSTNETRRHVTRGFHELPNDEALARVNLAPPPSILPKNLGRARTGRKRWCAPGHAADEEDVRSLSHGGVGGRGWYSMWGARQDETRAGGRKRAASIGLGASRRIVWLAGSCADTQATSCKSWSGVPSTPLPRIQPRLVPLSVDLRGSSGRASFEGQASEGVIRRPLRFQRYRERPFDRSTRRLQSRGQPARQR